MASDFAKISWTERVCWGLIHHTSCYPWMLFWILSGILRWTTIRMRSWNLCTRIGYGSKFHSQQNICESCGSKNPALAIKLRDWTHAQFPHVGMDMFGRKSTRLHIFSQCWASRNFVEANDAKGCKRLQFRDFWPADCTKHGDSRHTAANWQLTIRLLNCDMINPESAHTKIHHRCSYLSPDMAPILAQLAGMKSERQIPFLLLHLAPYCTHVFNFNHVNWLGIPVENCWKML